jgi:GNAT superfamily N-acetyltransferase
MSLRLIELVPHDYAARVLPVSASLWAGRRDLETYVRQTVEIANSPYGKRFYRTFGLFEGDALLASFKQYQRTIRMNGKRLRAVGLGAVFTPLEYRGRGYASAMLAMLCDQRRAAGDDLVYLFSDIKPAFYAALGFIELPSRLISLRADGLPGKRIAVDPIAPRDWPAIGRCFQGLDSTRAWGFERDATVWNWIRLRILHGSEHPVGSQCNLAVRRGRTIVAYTIGVRAPEHDAYIVDEYGFSDAAGAALIPGLLRSAAGDLRRVVGWLPPDGARACLPRGSVRARPEAIFMALALTSNGRRLVELASDRSLGDGVWSTDHV